MLSEVITTCLVAFRPGRAVCARVSFIAQEGADLAYRKPGGTPALGIRQASASLSPLKNDQNLG